MSTKSESWGSRVGLILAMAGNAVGLGNFLRFPVQAVQNGGGAFIIPYLVCFLLMGIPLLLIEWSMGRFGGRSGNHSTPYILDTMAKGRLWKYIGVFGIFTNIAVAAYYCYIESWTMSYVFHSIFGTFDGKSQGEVASFFNDYVDVGISTTGIPYEAVIFYVICLALNTWILSRGLAGVEKVAKIGMPLLILFGAFLAVKGLTLGTAGATPEHPTASAWDGLNFLWTPQFDSLSNPKVWLAAAGQIFFTLSVGMGTIHCYAAYVRSNDDIALNGVSAGFMNEFVEVVLGSLVVIPIAAGYLGIAWVQENASFGMAFQTMPYLFQQWGSVLAVLAGVFWFGLLFFAGITSSLAMGTPWMGFMRDEFKWDNRKGALSFGLIVLVLGLPTVFFYNYGVFDEYDYWAGTVSLVVFALLETIVFAWIFGATRGWEEINMGADIKLPGILKYIIKWVTPLLLLFVFVGSVITPKGNEWAMQFASLGSGNGWELDNSSLIKQLANASIKDEIASVQNPATLPALQQEAEALRNSIETSTDPKAVARFQVQYEKKLGRIKQVSDPGYLEILNKKLFYIPLARMLLLSLFVALSFLVYRAYNIRVKEGRNTP
ncbi:MAG: sodium-dependent transporter [Lewinellaceae bacterium]|nr:sodium-dependent transporter [Saprospiraceae bacterium]MCB9341097.1 sodium-dependent transporter [Lewinellaceae bacterium]